MILRIICIVIVILHSTVIFAQLEPLYVTYPINAQAINPAYAGSSGIASLSILVRKQSLILPNTGSSQYLSYNTPLSNGKAALGFQAFNSNFGAIGSSGGTGFNLSGAWRHHFTDSISVSVGAQFGFVQLPSIAGAFEFKSNAGLGVYLRTIDSYLGISMPVATKPTYSISQTTKYFYPRPTFINAGHVFTINENLDLKVGALYRIYDKNGGGDYDLNAVLWVKKVAGVGIWKNNTGSEVNKDKSIIISLEVQVSQKFRLGISYDAAASGKYGVTKTGRNSSLSLYNMMLRYDFDNLTGKINRFRFF